MCIESTTVWEWEDKLKHWIDQILLRGGGGGGMAYHQKRGGGGGGGGRSIAYHQKRRDSNLSSSFLSNKRRKNQPACSGQAAWSVRLSSVSEGYICDANHTSYNKRVQAMYEHTINHAYILCTSMRSIHFTQSETPRWQAFLQSWEKSPASWRGEQQVLSQPERVTGVSPCCTACSSAGGSRKRAITATLSLIIARYHTTRVTGQPQP